MRPNRILDILQEESPLEVHLEYPVLIESEDAELNILSYLSDEERKCFKVTACLQNATGATYCAFLRFPS